MWLFESIDNYGKMIEKISKTVFMFSLLLLYCISCVNNEFKDFMETISFGATYEIFGVELNLALFYLPIIMGVLEHVFKIHDKVSDLLKIRKTYDKYVIINGLIKKTNSNVSIKKCKGKLISKLMSKTFYQFASSTDPKIDSHYVTMALNEWCWFWIMLDTGLLLIALGVLFLVLNWSWTHFWSVILGFLLFGFMLFLIMLQTINYTNNEISAILSDEERREIIKKEIEDALQD